VTTCLLYRQSQIFARAGVELESLHDGGVGRRIQPAARAAGGSVAASRAWRAGKLHADDTPVPVLAPGLGKPKRGGCGRTVRDDRPAGDSTPAAVGFAYSPDRKGETSAISPEQLYRYTASGWLRGLDQIYAAGRIQEAGLAHVRRKFYDLEVAHKSPVAA